MTIAPGQHTENILAELGLTLKEVEKLLKSGIVYQAFNTRSKL